MFIAAGESKAEKIKEILESDSEDEVSSSPSATLPAGRVMSVSGEAMWVMDVPAASLLKHSLRSETVQQEL